MCTSRMFAFEAWKPLIFSLELYRALGVDLVVAHVESVIASIFEVMKYGTPELHKMPVSNFADTTKPTGFSKYELVYACPTRS